jgi:hypothetical protein
VGLIAVNWFGTLPAWLTFLAVVAAGIALRGGQLGPAIGYLREANATLETENRELKKQLAESVALVATLKARTDLQPLQEAILEQTAGHERRAQGRFEKTIVLLDLIAQRLGRDPERER